MKIVQINAVNKVRSTGRSTYETEQYLLKKGYESIVVYSDGPTTSNGYKMGSFLSRKLHALLSRISGIQGYYSKYSTKRLVRYLKNQKPTVVHLRNLHANYINLEILFNYLAEEDIPTVITLHDCWFYTGKCTHYTVENCYKWQLKCYSCPRLKKDNPSWLFDRTNKMFKDKKQWVQNIPRLAIVGVSDWITNEARKSFLSSAKLITRIYNWIDLSVFRPLSDNTLKKRLNLEHKTIILSVASSWSKSKGINCFIELSKQLDDSMVLVLVGKTPSKLILPDNIIHINETHNMMELVEYYSVADVFLNLSYEETFGKVVAEALGCGTPVITLNSTANPELIGKNCGFIVDSFDIETILFYINEILNKGKQYFSPYCTEFAEKNFSKDERLLDYINLYKEISKETRR